MALAPEIAAFGDGEHAIGETGLTISGGGFGAFPGIVWMFENADGSGEADELDIVSWNDIAIAVDIPETLNNAPGTVYLVVEREDLAWSLPFEFTLTESAEDTTPNPFPFVPQFGVELSTVITSGVAQVFASRTLSLFGMVGAGVSQIWTAEITGAPIGGAGVGYT
jgi:hypothetical protein